MNSIFSTPVLTLYYVLMFQPFALLHFLPFRSFLPEGKKKRMVRIWVLLVVAEYVAFTGLLQSGFFSTLQKGYWILGYVAWVPQFLLCLLAERKLWMGQLFVLSFRALLSGIFFTVSRALVLYLYPGRTLDELYGFQVLTYGAMIFLSFPFMLRFFTRTFSGFREASTRKYWRLITAVPMLMAIENIYLSLIDSNEMYFELLIPRLFLLVVVLMMASIRSGQDEVYHELQMFEEKHDLQQQYASAEHYVQMARESRERLNDIFREKQDHINQLLVLIHRKDKDGVLRYIEELGGTVQYHETSSVLSEHPDQRSTHRLHRQSQGTGDPGDRVGGSAPGYPLQRRPVHRPVQSGGKCPDCQRETAGGPAEHHRGGPAAGGYAEYIGEEPVRCAGAAGRGRAAGDPREGPRHRDEIPGPVPG